MNSLVADAALAELLDRLHAESEAQVPLIDAHYADGAPRPTGFEPEDSPDRIYWQDKFVAIDRDKAALVYSLCRAGGATRIVEAGTSFGVSTLYLAAAVKDNGGGLVTTCDIEAAKSAKARANLDSVGLAGFVDFRVGDIRDTLTELDGPVDFLLLDIWAPIAGDVLALVEPRLREGAMVVADNTTSRADGYETLLGRLRAQDRGFTTLTLPHQGGLELAVKTGG